jgi:tRNA-dihydrouridine synthase B
LTIVTGHTMLPRSAISMETTHQLQPLTLRGVTFDPPLFCAPMAGITHSAFRRLLGDFGGCGGLFSEMLSAKMVIHESPVNSPWLKRRPQDGKVIYQLLVEDTDRLDAVIDRLAALTPEGLDLNCGCGARTVCKRGGGISLYEDGERLRDILRVMRRHFSGPLTVKIRLGLRDEAWQEKLRDRLKLFEDEGIDGLTFHPRFAEEKFKYSARYSLYPDLAGMTRLPVIANGDITGPAFWQARGGHALPAAGLMVGRMAAARPWVFAQWHDPSLKVDLLEMWTRLCRYIEEDFLPRQAMARIKILTPYFARNFVYGHTLFKAVQGATDFATARDRSLAFLEASPQVFDDISLSGL